MSLAHLTLATRDVQKTATFFEETLGYPRDPMPTNIPDEAAGLNLGHGQQIHLVYVDGFEASPFERFFFRDPVNGYVFEVIDDVRSGRPEAT